MNRIKCILLVDDDTIATYINTTLIDGLGITDSILTATNGKEALDLLESSSINSSDSQGPWPELILLDVKMPVMGGFEFLEAFNQLNFNPAPKVAILSSSYHPKDVQKAKELNAAAFLPKPLTETALLNLFEKLEFS